jgi:hypothetical protein
MYNTKKSLLKKLIELFAENFTKQMFNANIDILFSDDR